MELNKEAIEIVEKLSQALTDDFEQGIHWMANQQAEWFKINFPCLSKTIEELVERYLNENTI